MENISLTTIAYTFAFLVPGYIIDEIIRSLIPIKKHEESVRLLKCLAYSIVNYAIWFSWGLILLGKVLDSKDIWYWCVIALAVIVTSSITGLIIGFIRAKGLVRSAFNRIFGRFDVSLTHPIPAAWDYVFYNLRDGAWLLIRMDNGKFIRGRFYTRSMASSDSEFRDIYLEEVYTKEKDNNWKKVERTNGVWLSPEAIKHIEFYYINQEAGKKDSGIKKSLANHQKNRKPKKKKGKK